jgi:hypothetical protein
MRSIALLLALAVVLLFCLGATAAPPCRNGPCVPFIVVPLPELADRTPARKPAAAAMLDHPNWIIEGGEPVRLLPPGTPLRSAVPLPTLPVVIVDGHPVFGPPHPALIRRVCYRGGRCCGS